MSRHFGSLLLFSTLVILANGLPQVNQVLQPDASKSIYQPYTVALKYKGEYTCSGAIISPTKILTTATCVDRCLGTTPGPKECKLMTVYAGSSSLSSGGNIHEIKSVEAHADFVRGEFASDIAVITLNAPIVFSHKELPIGLPDKDVVDDSSAVTSGWGKKSANEKLNDDLQNFERKIVTADKCNSEYFNAIRETKVDVNDFCGTSATGFCHADAGSPLIQDGKIIGISSWGIGCNREHPDVYTNVYRYLEFVNKQVE